MAGALADGVVGDHRQGAAQQQDLAQGVAVVGCVGIQDLRRWRLAQQSGGHWGVATLAWRDRQRHRPPVPVD